MDILNWIKIISAFALVILSFIISAIEIQKNPNYWLNRFFGLFFIIISLGFLLYTYYHMFELISKNNIIPVMISSNIFINFAFGCLTTTTFILKYSESTAMSNKYLLKSFILPILTSIAYLIWIPEIAEDEYSTGNVGTNSNPILMIIVNVYRIVIICYVLYTFNTIANHVEGKAKKQMKFFRTGMICILVGLVCELIGGENLSNGIYFEILSIVLFAFSGVIILKGFLVTA